MSELATRGGRTQTLWWLLWGFMALLAVTLLADALRRAPPLPVLALWFAPLLILLPGLLRDRLRSVTWLSFVSLMYFVMAVLRVFAEPGSLRAQLELLAVVGLFCAAMFYVRERARELRGDETGDPATDDH